VKDTGPLRDKLLKRLNTIVEDTSEDLSPSMVSACVNFLKTFPPEADLTDLTSSVKLADSLHAYSKEMPFRS
jgi:hypothetical protein